MGARAVDLLSGDAGHGVPADRIYPVTWGFAEGATWATWYVRNERELPRMIADILADAHGRVGRA
jgi:hypothetical protein